MGVVRQAFFTLVIMEKKLTLALIGRNLENSKTSTQVMYIVRGEKLEREILLADITKEIEKNAFI